jgi:hypothetical protein
MRHTPYSMQVIVHYLGSTCILSSSRISSKWSLLKSLLLRLSLSESYFHFPFPQLGFPSFEVNIFHCSPFCGIPMSRKSKDVKLHY